MSKIKFERMSPAVANLLGIILALVVGLVFSLPWGIGYAIDWVTNLALYSVIIEVAIDFVTKLKEKDHPKLCWQYFVGIVMILGAVWSMMATAHTVEVTPFFIWGAVTVFIAIGASIWFHLAVKSAYEKRLSAPIAEEGGRDVEKIIYLLGGVSLGSIIALCVSGILLWRGKGGDSGSSGSSSTRGSFYRGAGKVSSGLDLLSGNKRRGGFGQD